MNEHLRQLITPENVLSYSNACIEICDTLLTLKREGYQRLVIPSRGAYPFYEGALTSLTFLTDSFIERHNFISHFNVWLLPYTADWGEANLSITSKKIRTFWSKILADTIKMESTPYTLFYTNIVDLLGAKLTLNAAELKNDKQYKTVEIKDEKFIFIDTSISGQAICEVIESFKDFNLNDYFIILISDNNGERIKREFRTIIEREKQTGKLTEINVNCIYSEDASPLLNMGISSIVFPSLIERAYHEIPEFRRNEFAGAGLWFIDAVSHLSKLSPELNGVRGTLSTLNYIGIKANLEGKNKWFEEIVQDGVEKMIEGLGNFNLSDSNSTKQLIYDRIASKDGKLEQTFDVSNSHVVRVDLLDDVITQIIKSSLSG